MIYSPKQLKIFRNVKKREWLKQNRLREPFIRQFTSRLKNYFTNLGNGLKEDFAYGSTVMIQIRQNNALGLGHAILCAKHLINNEFFAVLLPDVIIFEDISKPKNYSFSHMKKFWDETGIGQIMVQKI